MKTTTATYNIRVETCDFKVIEFQRTMPTKPTTHNGIKAQNNKLEQWVMKELPFWSKIDITPLFSWTMTKTQILKVIKETAAPHNLDREQKFQVFANVCDNMLAEGRITQEQHIRWTNVF